MAEEDRGRVVFEDKTLEEGFGMIPACVLFDQELSAGAKAMYCALWYWGHNGDRTAPSQEGMAAEFGGGRRTVQRHLSDLEKAGYIETRIVGLGRPNEYVVKSLQSEDSRAPKMAHQVRHNRRIKGAKNGASHTRGLDVTTQRVQQQSADPDPVPSPDAPADPPGSVVVAHEDDSDSVTALLVRLGVAKGTARRLVRENDVGEVYRWACYTAWKAERGDQFTTSPAAFLVSALNGGDWVIPDWFRTPDEKAEASAAEEAKRAAAQAAEEARIAGQRAETLARLEDLSAGERERLRAECLETLPAGVSDGLKEALLPGMMAARLGQAQGGGGAVR